MSYRPAPIISGEFVNTCLEVTTYVDNVEQNKEKTFGPMTVNLGESEQVEGQPYDKLGQIYWRRFGSDAKSNSFTDNGNLKLSTITDVYQDKHRDLFEKLSPTDFVFSVKGTILKLVNGHQTLHIYLVCSSKEIGQNWISELKKIFTFAKCKS
jgi:hypothetical protein